MKYETLIKLGYIFSHIKVSSFPNENCSCMCEGTFWIQRFRDAWDSCSHKKAVAFAIFTLVWNLSSIVARIWAGKITWLYWASPDPKFDKIQQKQWKRDIDCETYWCYPSYFLHTKTIITYFFTIKHKAAQRKNFKVIDYHLNWSINFYTVQTTNIYLYFLLTACFVILNDVFLEVFFKNVTINMLWNNVFFKKK